jgi:hypothetical protein
MMHLATVALVSILLATPLVADAQPAGTTYRIGYLASTWEAARMDARKLVGVVERALSSSQTEGGVRAALDVILGHFRADMGMIHRLNAADQHLELVATSDGIPEPVLAAARRIPLGKGIAGETAQTGRPVSMCNLQTDTSGVARPGAKATGAQGVPLGDVPVG